MPNDDTWNWTMQKWYFSILMLLFQGADILQLAFKYFCKFCFIWAAAWMDKTNKMTCVPSEDSDQPGHPVWSESSMSAWRNCGSLATYLAHCEDSDQTAWMSRLIWVFLGCTGHFVMLKLILLTPNMVSSTLFSVSSASSSIIFSSSISSSGYSGLKTETHSK